MSKNANNANTVPMDPLSKAFGLDPLNGRLKPSGKLLVPDLNDDYEYGRQNIIDLIEKGNQYLQEFGQVALMAQEPRHFEVLTNMLNSLVDANERLMMLKKHDQDIKERDAKNNPDERSVTNNLFVGSTNDIQKLLKNMNTKKEEND